MSDGMSCFPGRVGNSIEDVIVCIGVARADFNKSPDSVIFCTRFDYPLLLSLSMWRSQRASVQCNLLQKWRLLFVVETKIITFKHSSGICLDPVTSSSTADSRSSNETIPWA